MGILYTKTDVPASESQRAEGGRTSEAHGTQPASETPSDVSQMTAQVYCVEGSIQQPHQEGNEGHILVLSEGTEGQGPQEATREWNKGHILVLSEGTEGQGPQEATRERNKGHILLLSEGTEGQGPQEATQEQNKGHILVLSEGTEGQGPREASQERSKGHILVLSEGTEEQGPQEATQEQNKGHILLLSEGTEGQGPRETSRERNEGHILVLSEGTEEQGPQEASQERNKGHILVLSEGTEEQEPQEATQKGSETPSLAGTSGSSEVAHGVLEESEIASELIELIEKFMAESDNPSTQMDLPCQLCQECLLREGSTSTLESDLRSSLMSELEPRISKEVSEALHPPPVGTLDSRGATEEAKPCREFKDAHTDVPIAEVIGAQATGPATQQQSPESVCISGTAPQTVPAGAEVDAGMTEEEAEIQAYSRAPETPEKDANRIVDGQEQESVVESPERDPFWFW